MTGWRVTQELLETPILLDAGCAETFRLLDVYVGA